MRSSARCPSLGLSLPSMRRPDGSWCASVPCSRTGTMQMSSVSSNHGVCRNDISESISEKWIERPIWKETLGSGIQCGFESHPRVSSDTTPWLVSRFRRLNPRLCTRCPGASLGLSGPDDAPGVLIRAGPRRPSSRRSGTPGRLRG